MNFILPIAYGWYDTISPFLTLNPSGSVSSEKQIFASCNSVDSFSQELTTLAQFGDLIYYKFDLVFELLVILFSRLINIDKHVKTVARS